MTQSIHERGGDEPGIGHLTEIERHRLMAADRRQTTLSVLRELTTPISLDALARAVAVREHKADVAEAVIDTVKVSLHHNHLPKMADLDVLDYDPEAQQIR